MPNSIGYAEDAANGAIGRSFAAKVVGKLNAKIEEVQRRIAAAVTPPALAGDPGEDAADQWNRAPISARREVLRLLTTSIVVRKGGPGQVDERVAIEW